MISKTTLVNFFCIVALVSWSLSAKSELSVNIIGGVDKTIPVAILPFKIKTNQHLEYDLAKILSKNLVRSGVFSTIKAKGLRSKRVDEVINYKFYRALGAEQVISGQIKQQSKDYFVLTISLHDVILRRKEWTYEWQFKSDAVRQSAHRVSDLVFEHITGRKSAFSSRIAYISVKRLKNKKRQYKLQVADTDGYNPHTIAKSDMPILSPSWSPDSKQLAYVSFESGRSEIYINNIYQKKRKLVASYPGINSAPTWSPNGRFLAVTLSLHGNSEVYTINLYNGVLTRLTNHPSIDTEPVYSPDGLYIYFTSDRTGSAQIYRITLKTKAIQRITKTGVYNAGASISHNGQYLSLIHSSGNGLRVALHDIQGNETSPITNTFLDDSPSISPGGNMLIYSSTNRNTGRSNLVMMDLRGRTQQILRTANGELKDATWGPFRTNFSIKQ